MILRIFSSQNCGHCEDIYQIMKIFKQMDISHKDDDREDISQPKLDILRIFIKIGYSRNDDDCEDISQPKLWNGVLEYLLVIGNPWQDGSTLII